jgi:hypothetical protein
MKAFLVTLGAVLCHFDPAFGSMLRASAPKAAWLAVLVVAPL